MLWHKIHERSVVSVYTSKMCKIYIYIYICTNIYIHINTFTYTHLGCRRERGKLNKLLDSLISEVPTAVLVAISYLICIYINFSLLIGKEWELSVWQIWERGKVSGECYLGACLSQGFYCLWTSCSGICTEFITMRKQSSFNMMAYLLKYTINKYD